MKKRIKIKVKLKEPAKRVKTQYGVKLRLKNHKGEQCFNTGAVYNSELAAVLAAHAELATNPVFQVIMIKKYFTYVLNCDEGLLCGTSLVAFTAKYLSQFVYSKEVECETGQRAGD